MHVLPNLALPRHTETSRVKEIQIGPRKRLKVLLSAYACEPNRGSEPGVGWEWATRLPAWHDVTVITRANNEPSISAELARRGSLPAPSFIYLDLPPFFTRLKKCGALPVSLYYLLWQLFARSAVKAQLGRFDLVHHVTFNGFRFPGAWWKCPARVLLGPLGGGSIARSDYRSCFGHRWWTEKLRELSVRLWRLNPWTWASLRQADAVIVVGEELRERLSKFGIPCMEMLETALPLDLEDDLPAVNIQSKRHFIWVGSIEPRKAWQIALEAYALALKRGLTGHRLRVVGCGPQERSAVRKARNLGIGDKVDFVGVVPRSEVWKLVAEARALLFTSIRDSSGNVVLEAMGLRCPVICFKHQGAAMMTDEQCAIRICPGSWHDSVAGFAAAMLQLASDDSMAQDMGFKGRLRALEHFSWDAKVSAALEVYSRLSNLPVPEPIT